MFNFAVLKREFVWAKARLFLFRRLLSGFLCRSFLCGGLLRFAITFDCHLSLLSVGGLLDQGTGHEVEPVL